MGGSLRLHERSTDLREMVRAETRQLAETLHTVASRDSLDLQQNHPDLHAAIIAQLISVYDVDLTTARLVFSFDTDLRLYRLQIKVDPSEKDRILNATQD